MSYFIFNQLILLQIITLTFTEKTQTLPSQCTITGVAPLNVKYKNI